MLLTVVWTGIWKPDWIEASSPVCVCTFGVEMTLTRPRASAAWIVASSLNVSRTFPAARLSTAGAPLGRATRPVTEPLLGKTSPVVLPCAASAVAWNPQTMPRDCEKVRVASTIRVSIMTWRFGMSRFRIRSRTVGR